MQIFGAQKGKKEHCVVCREETGYTVETPIWHRKNYIEGVGQLCRVCAKEIELEILKEEMNGDKNG